MNTISSKNTQDSHDSTGAAAAPADKVLTRVPNGTSAGHPVDRVAADPPSHPEKKDGHPRSGSAEG